MDVKNALEGLTDEQREQARALKTPEEIINFAKEQGFELSDDQLEAVSGGSWLPTCDHTLAS